MSSSLEFQSQFTERGRGRKRGKRGKEGPCSVFSAPRGTLKVTMTTAWTPTHLGTRAFPTELPLHPGLYINPVAGKPQLAQVTQAPPINQLRRLHPPAAAPKPDMDNLAPAISRVRVAEGGAGKGGRKTSGSLRRLWLGRCRHATTSLSTLRGPRTFVYFCLLLVGVGGTVTKKCHVRRHAQVLPNDARDNDLRVLICFKVCCVFKKRRQPSDLGKITDRAKCAEGEREREREKIQEERKESSQIRAQWTGQQGSDVVPNAPIGCVR
ncbi:hypothetical protein JZ751_007370 [Albula glossodonta]|uniref:Uncharacterized protein n=1 Tax=Albula glossodonta TaxID=121402 RepID=A0A8T2N3A6_9TELE|nr:hypothetical protein JZ751_007370 [Albula glossodonta]